MNEVAATVGRCPAPRRSRVNKSNMPHLPIFADELLRGEPTHGLDDVLLSGSDDEYYDSPGARSRRLEEHARLFLEGRRPRLLSASLKGPFGRETGWENPWRGRGGKVAEKGACHSTKTQRPSTVSTSGAGVGSRQQTAAPPTRSASSNDLGTTPSTTFTDKDPELKKRAAGTDWLRRKNLKRLRSNYDNALTASPSASRSTRVASIAKVASAPTTPNLARALSEPAQDAAVSDDIVEDSTETVPNHSFADVRLSVSHISDSEPSMSVPSDLLWRSHVETEPTIPQFPLPSAEATIHAGVETIPAVKGDAPESFGDDTTLLSVEQGGTKKPGEPLPSKPHPSTDVGTDVDVAKPNKDAQQDVEPTEPSNEAPDEKNISNFADTTLTTSGTDTAVDEGTKLPKIADDTEMMDARLATQDQSPWTKTQTNATMDDMITNSPVGAPVTEQEEDSHAPAALTTQSPWSRETQPLLPAAADPQPDLPFTKVEANKPELGAGESSRPSLSLSQNPWAEVNTAAASFSSSISNLPTSPCSPDKAAASLPPIERSKQEQEHEPFLPSLPIPIVHSSGTAPSTPDTKQSSLPTPDMTVSIKSFRRFRSPTPTPPPRRRSTKARGPRSILSQPRRRSGANPSATKSGRRVHFSLSEDEAAAAKNEGADGTAATGQNPATDQTHDESRGRKSTQGLRIEASSRPQQRAASPPPQDKALMVSLPTEVDRFKSHFATVAGRTRGQQAAMSAASRSSTAQCTDTGASKAPPITMSKRQDPALDLELYSSPSVDAMASRFQEVDAETSKLQQISSGQSRQSSVVSHAGDKAPGADGGDNKENATRGRETEQHEDDDDDDDRDDDAASAVDDVQDVMDNLDDFLGLWDMDAELAEVRASRM